MEFVRVLVMPGGVSVPGLLFNVPECWCASSTEFKLISAAQRLSLPILARLRSESLRVPQRVGVPLLVSARPCNLFPWNKCRAQDKRRDAMTNA